MAPAEVSVTNRLQNGYGHLTRLGDREREMVTDTGRGANTQLDSGLSEMESDLMQLGQQIDRLEGLRVAARKLSW